MSIIVLILIDSQYLYKYKYKLQVNCLRPSNTWLWHILQYISCNICKVCLQFPLPKISKYIYRTSFTHKMYMYHDIGLSRPCTIVSVNIMARFIVIEPSFSKKPQFIWHFIEGQTDEFENCLRFVDGIQLASAMALFPMSYIEAISIQFTIFLFDLKWIHKGKDLFCQRFRVINKYIT